MPGRRRCPFLSFLQWFYDTKPCQPKLTQLQELVQIIIFNITVSSLELVNSGAIFHTVVTVHFLIKISKPTNALYSYFKVVFVLYYPTRVSDSKSIFMGSQYYQNYQSKRSLHVVN
jgi:hypothetical protein